MATAMRKEFLKPKKLIHPNSRKSIAIAKKAKKISNRQKGKMSRLIKQNLIGEKILWIKNNMIPDVCPYTPELTASLLEKYIARNDKEMEQIAIKRSISSNRNRQHASRANIIRITKEREQEEYDTCGIEIPDILDEIQCKMLMAWNDELHLMNNFNFIRFGKKDLKKALKVKEMPMTTGILTISYNKPVDKENLLNKSIDSNENNQSTKCVMEIE
ncbi:translation machinery-associated protein 16 isoform X1 [Bombus pascuorum]|uniref:translation machinery-associated protein 16 isoform X1 n=2 Tax=Bombus pascuorum TaxID=65598 RepID=UPI002122983F|nr:translation machinery-associated protein 16 isoform X1 [Bombus pascuorum]